MGDQAIGTGAVPDAQAITQYGGKVWASVWTPPAAYKGNDSLYCTDQATVHLLTSAYESWASTLAAFPALFKDQSGVDLYAISPQSEPDSCPTGTRGCLYSTAELADFAKVLGPKLHALNPSVRLLAPESESWSNLWGGEDYGNAILNDSAASCAVDILATHDIGGSGPTRPSAPAGNTHPVWETAVYDTLAPDPSIDNGIGVAQQIHAAVTTGGASAWHYWWLVSQVDDNEGLLLQDGDTTNPPKRLYALGNFSKFVRPGYVRVSVSDQVPSGVQVAAFDNPLDDTVVIVAINSHASPISLSVFISGAAPCSMTPWVTSSSDNLASKTPVSVSDSRLTYSLEARSVTTLVGKR